jgi:spore germination cell wall hydrolase CwlJ-like protein
VLIRPQTALVAALAFLATACTQTTDIFDDITTGSIARPVAHDASDRECLARAMFFESHRSSREGLIAVGTVVMNRVESGEYPESICGVVGQKNQFAPGVMTRPLNSKALPDVMAAADAVLAGERHPQVQKAMFFHQAGLSFPYPNMHYVLKAGGNAFYEKRGRAQRAETGVRSQSQLAAAGRIEGARSEALSFGGSTPTASADPAAAAAEAAGIASSTAEGVTATVE